MTTAAAAAVLSKLNKYSVLAAGNLARETKFETRFQAISVLNKVVRTLGSKTFSKFLCGEVLQNSCGTQLTDD